MALKDQLRQDAASLQQFVLSTTEHFERNVGASAYLRSSETFFEYISKLACSTRRYLAETLQTTTDPAELLSLRGDINSLRSGWRFLHGFIKPVLDADTLRLPSSLVVTLTARFREIPKFADTEFVIYHSDTFNYFNVRVSVLKQRADKISGIVAGPDFPGKLGLIGIPYSQASSLFMNCLIPHEMGHYVFGELLLGHKFKVIIENELTNRLGGVLNHPDRFQIVEQLALWVEEVFCDIFAVRLVGFCFSLAFVELFDVSTSLDEASTYSPSRSTGKTDFLTYPPDLFRLRQQVRVLMQDGWWSDVRQIDSHYIRTLEAAAALQDASFGFPVLAQYRLDPTIVSNAFLTTVPRIFDELDAITSGLRPGADGWKRADKDISTYLKHGVVPSTIAPSMSNESRANHPELIALLNASYKFYLLELNALLANIDQADIDNIDDRVKWATRVEMWTAKALEDVLIMTGRIF